MFTSPPSWAIIRLGSDINGGNEYDFLRDVPITRASHPAIVSVGERPSRDYHCGKRTPALIPFAVKFIGDRVKRDPIVGTTRVTTFVVTSKKHVQVSGPQRTDRDRTLAILGPEGTLDGSL